MCLTIDILNRHVLTTRGNYKLKLKYMHDLGSMMRSCMCWLFEYLGRMLEDIMSMDQEDHHASR